MKKVKMMLLSLSLVAVVGGTLAFKARFDQAFCTASPQNGACPSVLACLNKNISKIIDQAGTQNLVCTTTYDNNNCASPLKCTTDGPVSLITN